MRIGGVLGFPSDPCQRRAFRAGPALGTREGIRTVSLLGGSSGRLLTAPPFPSQLLEQSLREFGQPWELNPGDGAFYGPKVSQAAALPEGLRQNRKTEGFLEVI